MLGILEHSVFRQMLLSNFHRKFGKSKSMIRQFSAGGVVYKRNRNQVSWLIRRAKPSEYYKGTAGWSLPKGWIDVGEKSQDAAIREVKEETGVEAKIVSKIGEMKYFFVDENKEKVFKIVTYYLMEYAGETGKGFDEETEEIKWVTIDEALERVRYKNEREMVENGNKLLSDVTERTKNG